MRSFAIAAVLVAAALVAPAWAQSGPPPKEDKWAKHWRERREAFKAENAKLDASATYAVFVGDSITEGFPLAASFKGERVLNRGISADTVGVTGERGVLRRLDDSVFECRPRVVFRLIGVNDLSGSGRTPDTFVRGVAEIADAARARAPAVRLVLQTVLPTGKKYARHEAVNPRIVAFNEGLRSLAKERKLALLDLHDAYRGADGLLPDELSNDGLHLKRDAYALWAELARPHLR